MTGGPEYDAGPRCGGPGDLAPQIVELSLGHPVLGVEQNKSVDVHGRHSLQRFGEGSLQHRYSTGIFPNLREIPFTEIRRQRPGSTRRIRTGECLPGEIVVAQREITGEALEPLLENIGHRRRAGGERIILSRRNAETKERGLAADDPLDEPLFEQGHYVFVKEQPLLAHRPRPQHRLWIDAIDARNGVAHADEPAEQAALVDIALEMGDTLS